MILGLVYTPNGRFSFNPLKRNKDIIVSEGIVFLMLVFFFFFSHFTEHEKFKQKKAFLPTFGVLLPVAIQLRCVKIFPSLRVKMGSPI